MVEGVAARRVEGVQTCGCSITVANGKQDVRILLVHRLVLVYSPSIQTRFLPNRASQVLSFACQYVDCDPNLIYMKRG